MSLVSTQRDGKLLIVCIARPSVRNAVNGPTARALFDAFVEFDRDGTNGWNAVVGCNLKNFVVGCSVFCRSSCQPHYLLVRQSLLDRLSVSRSSTDSIMIILFPLPLVWNVRGLGWLICTFLRFPSSCPDSLCVAILCGQGPHFCAGADLSAVSTPDSDLVNPLLPVTAGSVGPMGPTRLLLSKPVIAALSGFVVAGGLELACWADLRVADETTQLGVFCRRWGVPLIDGGTQKLPQLIGLSAAMDLILTGRAVSAQEVSDICCCC
jgi:enoyl-CoA hydratase/carnithine racemase